MLQSCLRIIASVKDFLFGQQLNRYQEFNGGAELETPQSFVRIIAFVTEYILGPQLKRCQEIRRGWELKAMRMLAVVDYFVQVPEFMSLPRWRSNTARSLSAPELPAEAFFCSRHEAAMVKTRTQCHVTVKDIGIMAPLNVGRLHINKHPS